MGIAGCPPNVMIFTPTFISISLLPLCSLVIVNTFGATSTHHQGCILG